MAESSKTMGHMDRLAQPLHIQRLERSLSLQPFLNYVENIFTDHASDDSGTELSESRPTSPNGLASTRDERRSDKMRLFNFDSVRGERERLRDILVSDSSDDSVDGDTISEQRFQEMLREHVLEKKIRRKYYSNPANVQFQYYGTGLLSNYDKFPEHQDALMGPSRGKEFLKIKKKEVKNENFRKKGKRVLKKENSFNDSLEQDDADLDDRLVDDFDDEPDVKYKSGNRRGRRKADKNKSPEVMALRRRKLWANMAKKEMAKCQRSRINKFKENVTVSKKIAQMCIKHWKQKALQSQKNMKETVWRNKRLAREMQTYWKRYERVERDARRRQEREAEEQRKMDVEFMEAKRQQRKLNFLITQTELYAHFISKKISSGVSGSDKQRILNQLDEEENPRLAAVDDYNSEDMKVKAARNVENAVSAEKARSRAFELGTPPTALSSGQPDERPQPNLFRGTLKHYQLKGMNWLANLYDQGINGILADEMGLGKTVQSVAFLCHIAEKYSVWGPFLIISPASTLHNWQQEMERFVPDFKVVPYWGSVQERRILRQFWEQKDLHTRDASFHVVITSYQLVISDFKYFNRIKWQYLILDEAQAIKSSNSMRWKLLLGFSCRNRLLLSGTPIQNSMAELWALLHFIMPTLFDNHDEFSEWFSKDIEGQAENKSKIDEKHLSRLHLILKPFMLRRIKKDVENELSDKIEIMVYCPLTTRQKLLYTGLKQKIRVEDLLAGIGGRSGSTGDEPGKNVTSSLMNLVMQFRKVCNHPELFERREARSPFFQKLADYVVPKLVYEDGFLWRNLPSRRHITHNLLSISSTKHIFENIVGCFSFLRFIGLSPEEAQRIITGGILAFFMSLKRWRHQIEKIQHESIWSDNCQLSTCLLVHGWCILMPPNSEQSSVLNDLLFTRTAGVRSRVYTHTRHVHHSMAETLEHRILRSQKMREFQTDEESGSVLSPIKTDSNRSEIISASPEEPRLGRKPSKISKSPGKTSDENLQNFIVPEFPFIERPPRTFECQPTILPEFLYYPCLKVQTRARAIYSSCRNCAWETTRHNYCANPSGYDAVWYGHPDIADRYRLRHRAFHAVPDGGLTAVQPSFGWSNIVIPDKQTLVADAGKLYVLDGLLKRLKEGGHRVLIYSQMTRMIDLLEEYMWHRKHTYKRLDGSSKISERRDMVADFQARADIFVFLLSTRAGGLGINLTAADTVIFYDSDWNPTVDQQAMDRAHRLGQTKQVTVYRLICKGTIEERILQRAREKSEIQRMVISGGNFKPDHLKPKEVVSLLLDDEEIEKKYNQKQAEKKVCDDAREKGKIKIEGQYDPASKSIERDFGDDGIDSTPQSPSRSEISAPHDDTSNDGVVVDVDSPLPFCGLGSSPLNPLGIGSLRVRPIVRGSRRGRPRGVRRGASNAVRKRAYDADIKLPGEMFLTGESPSSSADSLLEKRPRGIKRGPGRPRMKPYIPGARGTRGKRPRRAPAPLQVPLARASSSTQPRPYGFYTAGPE